MLAETVARLIGVVPRGNIFVVTGRRQRRRVLSELPQLDPAAVLAEPSGRNTAPCIGWASVEIRRRCGDAVTAVLAADHSISAAKQFRSDLERAFAVADRGYLVTFGIRPTSAATGYGYIRCGAAIGGASPARLVDAFVEKPDAATAKRFLANGKYLWNSGLFVWRADAILEEIGEQLPALAAGLAAIDGARRRGAVPQVALERAWAKLPSVSIDYGVLEKSRRVAVLPASFSWSDIGSWDAAGELWPADRRGNLSRDPLLAIDASGNVVATRGKPVVLLGVDRLVVVDAGDAILVCPRDRCQQVREVPGLLAAADLGELR